MKSVQDEWEDNMDELECFSVEDAAQLRKVMIELYIAGKTDFQLKFSEFSMELYEQLKDILKMLPGFEIFHMTPKQIQIKDLGDLNSLKSLKHELCQKRLKALEDTIKSQTK